MEDLGIEYIGPGAKFTHTDYEVAEKYTKGRFKDSLQREEN